MSKHNIRNNSNSWIIDEKYEIEKNNGWGTIYYYSGYTGKRYKVFPQWLFDLQFELINKHREMLNKIDYLLSHNKNYTNQQYNTLQELKDLFLSEYI